MRRLSRPAIFTRPALAAAVLAAVAVVPASSLSVAPAPAAAAGVIEVVDGGCTLPDAIIAANERKTKGSCSNDGGSNTVLITPLSGSGLVAGTYGVPGVGLDAASAPSELVAGARTVLPPIKGDVVIEGSGDLTGIYLFPLPLQLPTCRLESGTVVCEADTSQPRGARLLRVASTGSLTIRNLTLGGGTITGGDAQLVLPYPCSGGSSCYGSITPAGSVRGGAIYAEGPVTLEGVTLLDNSAEGGAGSDGVFPNYFQADHKPGDALGGAVYAETSLTVSGSLFRGNRVTGGAQGGDARGADIALAAGATAVVTDTVFQGSVATGGSGRPGLHGADGANGANGAAGSCATNSPDGKDGQNGVGGVNGTDGGNGGDAVAVIDGGKAVIVSYSAVVGATANAGAAGLGGIGGVGGDGGNGGKGVSCSGTGIFGNLWSIPGVGGDGGKGASNGRIGTSGSRGTAVATFDVRERLTLLNTTVAGATAVVPEDLVPSCYVNVTPRPPCNPESLTDWENRRTRALNTVGVGGTGGLDAAGKVRGTTGGNGTPDRTIFDRDNASARGGAFGFGPDTTDRAEVSYSTIADVALQAPTTANRRPGPSFRYLTLALGAVLFNSENVGFRGSVLWNPDAATCPNMGSRGANVHDGRCLGGRAGDQIVTQRPVAAQPQAVGAPIRPGPLPGEPPVRMMTLPLASTSPAVDFTARAEPPACQPVNPSGPTFADDARREARDNRCDAGSFEYTGDAGLALEMPPFFYLDDVFDGEVVTVVLPSNPGPASTLTVTVLGSDGQTSDQPVDVAFDSPLVASTPAVGAAASVVLDLPDSAFPLRLPLRVVPRGGTTSVIVNAKVEGSTKPLDVTETRVVTVDARISVSVFLPPEVSTCQRYVPITYLASSTGRSPVRNVQVELSPDTRPDGTFEPAPTVSRPGESTFTEDPLTGRVTWTIPDFLGKQQSITTYLAVGNTSVLTDPYQPGRRVTASARWSLDGGTTWRTADVSTRTGALITQDPSWLATEVVGIDGIAAGETRTVDLFTWNLNGLFQSCAPGGDIAEQRIAAGVEGGWVEVVGADPAVTGPLYYLAGNGVPRTNPPAELQFTAPDEPGWHDLQILVDVAGGKERQVRTQRYLVRAPLITITGPADAPEGSAGTTTRTFEVSLERPAPVPISVDWTTTPGTADATDFVAASGTVTFAPGEVKAEIPVEVVGDTTVEPDEAFSVTLSRNQGDAGRFAPIWPPLAEAVLRNDDTVAPPPTTTAPPPTTTAAPTSTTAPGSGATTTAPGSGATTTTAGGGSGTTPAAGQRQVTTGGCTAVLGVSGGKLLGFDRADTSVPAPPGYRFPCGAVGYSASTTPGGLVTFTLSTSFPPSAFFKLVGTRWLPFTWDGETGARIDGTTVTVVIRDNGRGDDDPTPGVVRDPSAPAADAIGELPRTGTDPRHLVAVALLVIAVGLVLASVRRRART